MPKVALTPFHAILRAEDRKMSKRTIQKQGGQGGKRWKKPKTPDILLTVDTVATFDRRWAWRFGEVTSWKSLENDEEFSVEYSCGSPNVIDMLKNMDNVDTTIFEQVLDTVTWDHDNKKWKIESKDWSLESQRFLVEAFDEDFANSAGRNSLHSLLKALVTGDTLNIYNVGGGSTKNKKLRTLGIQYNYDEDSFSTDSSSESSPEKFSPEKLIPQRLSCSEKSSPEKSSFVDFDYTYTPVMDCLVWGPETIMVADVKTGRHREQHREQLREQLLSQLSLRAHCRVTGVLISQLEAALFLAAKDPKQINIIELQRYKFHKGNLKMIFSNFLKDMVKLIRACETIPNFPF